MEIGGAAKATESGFKVIGSLARWLRAHRTERKDLAALRRVLGMHSQGSWSYRVGSHHPLRAVGDPFPDDRIAFACLAGYDFAQAEAGGLVTVAEDVDVTLSDALVLIGGPESEAVTRLAFGYRSSPDGMQFSGDVVDLPFRWEEDRAKVRAMCKRYTPEGRLVVRPNWPIVDQRGRVPDYVFPTLSNDGMLENDLLLITKVPNYLTLDGLQSGRSIINIGGTHGIANRAVRLLMTRPAALRAIAKAMPECKGFQVLLRAEGIDHDPRAGSHATDLTVVAVAPLSRPYAVWDEARTVVERQRAAWLADVGPLTENL